LPPRAWLDALPPRAWLDKLLTCTGEPNNWETGSQLTAHCETLEKGIFFFIVLAFHKRETWRDAETSVTGA
jgi:hypothetical protein